MDEEFVKGWCSAQVMTIIGVHKNRIIPSQDQATSWLRTQEKGVSLLWIYQLVIEDRARGGDLRLRRKGKTRRMMTDEDRMPNRVGIASRPAIVEEKSRMGDWEVDFVAGIMAMCLRCESVRGSFC